jgi:hypothetical protein
MELMVYVSNDVLHAYQTNDKKIILYEKQNHVDGFTHY